MQLQQSFAKEKLLDNRNYFYHIADRRIHD